MKLGPGVITCPAVITLDNKSRLCALNIVINVYPKDKSLAGAITDTNAIEDFLTTNFKVSSNYIIGLGDSLASGEAIIQGFRSLRNGLCIRLGDPILVYHVGHDGLGQVFQKWKTKFGSDKIQVVFLATIMPRYLVQRSS